MNKVKVLLIIPSFEGGGAERVMMHLVSHLKARKKYHIRIVLFSDKIEYDSNIFNDIEVVCLNKINKFSFVNLIFGIRKQIKDFSPRVVLSSMFYANILLGITSILFNPSCKIIFWEHNYLRSYLDNAKHSVLKKNLMRITYRKSNVIVAVSKGIKKVIETDLSVPFDKVINIYNPIPLDQIVTRANEPVKHVFFEDSSLLVFTAVGRLNKQKRFDRLIDAFIKVNDKYSNTRLLILGQGEKENYLKGIVTHKGLDEVVDLVGFKTNPYPWMRSSFAFVMSSDFEGFPMTLLEAMACEVPVVSVDCPTGPNEIIVNKKNGILVGVDVEALAAGMISLINGGNDYRNKLVLNAFHDVEAFSFENIFKVFEKQFEA